MADLLNDASDWVALGYPRDQNPLAAKPVAAQHETGLLIQEVVFVKAICSLQRLGGTPTVVRFASLLMSQSPLVVPLKVPDFARAIEVLRTCSDADLDFVDCGLTALADTHCPR